MMDMMSMEFVRDREQLAWLGGFIDGEGSIGISRAGDRRRDRPTMRASIQIGNTNRESLERALGIMGLPHYSITVLASATDRHATQYHINIRERAAVAVTLARVIPYLHIKRRQAEIVLAFVRRRMAYPGRGRYAPYDNSDLFDYATLRQLNKRGPK